MKSFALKKTGLLLLMIAAHAAARTQTAPAPKDSIEVRVVVAIVVDKEGNISRTDIIENSCRKCSKALKKSIQEETLRIIKEGPKMEPRPDKNGKPQVTYYKQPIVFKITDQ